MSIVKTPKPPYYVIIFTSKHTNVEKKEYDKISTNMVELAQNISGFFWCVCESIRDTSGFGITSGYWND